MKTELVYLAMLIVVIVLMTVMLLSGCMRVYVVELGFPPAVSCHGLGCPEDEK